MSSVEIPIEHGAKIRCYTKCADTIIVIMKHSNNTIYGEVHIDEAIQLRNFLNEFIGTNNE